MKKGFTLIELLAVIVIMSVVALISTPIIIGIIDQVKKSAFIASAENVLKATEFHFVSNSYNMGNLGFVEFGISKDDSAIISYKGDKPDKGSVVMDNNGNVGLYMYDENLGLCASKSFSTTSKVVGEYITLEECENKITSLPLAKISTALQYFDEDDISTKDAYVGDFYRVGPVGFAEIRVAADKDYYVNFKTGEVYDIDGVTYEDEGLQLTYHTIDEYVSLRDTTNVDDVNDALLIKRQQLQYLEDQQYSNGAIATYTRIPNTETRVVPYFACTAAEGFLGDIGSYNKAKEYILWHLNHINQNADVNGVVGTIYDYHLDDASNESIADIDDPYDSVDSYASLFFTLLEEYYKKTGDKQLLIDNKATIEKAINALDEMYNEDLDLTITKTTYGVYYLMDNTESYAGYRSLEYIYNYIYNDPVKAAEYSDKKRKIGLAIEEHMYDTADAYSEEFEVYDYAYQNSSYNRVLFDKIYYPDVLGQLYPIIHGLADVNSDRAKHLYFLHKTYDEPAWYTFEHEGSTYPHVESLYAALLMNQDNITIHGNDVNIAYHIAMALSKLEELYHQPIDSYAWNSAEAGYIIKSVNLYLHR